jgi:hypothetical protein
MPLPWIIFSSFVQMWGEGALAFMVPTPEGQSRGRQVNFCRSEAAAAAETCTVRP